MLVHIPQEAKKEKVEMMKKILTGMFAVAFAMTIGLNQAEAAPGDSIGADYNFGNAPGNTFDFSAPTGGNAWVQFGDVTTQDQCDPIGSYVYYPWTDHTIFSIYGPTQDGGFVDIRGNFYGQELYGNAGYYNHCFYADGPYILTPMTGQED